jgi:hypothetical protein
VTGRSNPTWLYKTGQPSPLPRGFPCLSTEVVSVANFFTYLPTCLPAYVPTYLPSYLPTYLGTPYNIVSFHSQSV